MLKPDSLPITFGESDVEIIVRGTPHRGFFSLDLYRFCHCLFNGQMSHEVRREISERGHAAVLLPFDPVRGEVTLIEQIRIAVYDTSEALWPLEMTAGMVKKDESVEDVARREVIGEAGLVVRRIKPVLSFLASPRGASERSSIMVGEVDTTTASGIHSLADENEDIRAHVVSWEQACQRVEERKIDNVASAIALQQLQLYRQALENERA